MKRKVLVGMDTTWAFSADRLMQNVSEMVRRRLPWKGDVSVDFGYTKDSQGGRDVVVKLAVIKWYAEDENGSAERGA